MGKILSGQQPLLPGTKLALNIRTPRSKPVFIKGGNGKITEKCPLLLNERPRGERLSEIWHSNLVKNCCSYTQTFFGYFGSNSFDKRLKCARRCLKIGHSQT